MIAKCEGKEGINCLASPSVPSAFSEFLGPALSFRNLSYFEEKQQKSLLFFKRKSLLSMYSSTHTK